MARKAGKYRRKKNVKYTSDKSEENVGLELSCTKLILEVLKAN